MCTVLILPDGVEVDHTVRLRELLQGEPPWERGYEHLKGCDGCLCLVDMRRVGEMLGYRLRWDGGDYFAERRQDA